MNFLHNTPKSSRGYRQYASHTVHDVFINDLLPFITIPFGSYLICRKLYSHPILKLIFFANYVCKLPFKLIQKIQLSIRTFLSTFENMKGEKWLSKLMCRYHQFRVKCFIMDLFSRKFQMLNTYLFYRWPWWRRICSNGRYRNQFVPSRKLIPAVFYSSPNLSYMRNLTMLTDATCEADLFTLQEHLRSFSFFFWGSLAFM